MINFENTKLGQIIVHKLGNKTEDEGILYSSEPLKIEGEFIQNLMLKFFLSSFKNENFYKFHHENDIKFNEIYNYTNKIFDNEKSLMEHSKNIAKHLYESSNHPKIKSGEFYIVIIHDCMLDDEVFDAIGIFKTENKDTYLKIKEKDNSFEIDFDNGININKLDKGCLIFNTEKENGYIISIVDNINKSKGANFWKDDFMQIKAREDNYFFTENYLNMCKTFADKGIKDTEKSEQIELKNKTMNYFKENESFNIDEFEEEVISKPETKEAFKEYKQNYEEEKEVKMSDDFEISDTAVKKAKRKYKSVIKLDKNFHIYVHGKQEHIKKGFDNEKNKSFYQLYFDEEN